LEKLKIVIIGLIFLNLFIGTFLFVFVFNTDNKQIEHICKNIKHYLEQQQGAALFKPHELDKTLVCENITDCNFMEEHIIKGVQTCMFKQHFVVKTLAGEQKYLVTRMKIPNI